MPHLLHRRSAANRAQRPRRIRKTFTNAITDGCNDELAVIAGRFDTTV